MVDIEIIPNDVIQLVLVCLFLFLMIITITAVAHSKGTFPDRCSKLGCHRMDNVRPARAWIFTLQMWDLLTDIYFSYTLIATTLYQYTYREQTNSHTRKIDLVTLLLGAISPIFIILPYCANMYAAVTLYKRGLMNSRARLYFEQRIFFFCFLVLVSGGVSASISLVCSKLFGLPILDCGLSKRELQQFTTKFQFRYCILLENIPQLIIQIVYIIDVGRADTAVQLALCASFFSILTAVFRWCFTKQIDFDNQLILTVNVSFDKTSIQDDVINCVKYMGRRERLEKCISQALYVYDRKIEVFAIIPTNQGCILHFGYIMDTHMHKFGESQFKLEPNHPQQQSIRTDDTINNPVSPRTNAFELYETEDYVVNKVIDACTRKSGIAKAVQDTWYLKHLPCKVVLLEDFEIEYSTTTSSYGAGQYKHTTTRGPNYKNFHKQSSFRFLHQRRKTTTRDSVSDNYDYNNKAKRGRWMSVTQTMASGQGHTHDASINLYVLTKDEISQVKRGAYPNIPIPTDYSPYGSPVMSAFPMGQDRMRVHSRMNNKGNNTNTNANLGLHHQETDLFNLNSNGDSGDELMGVGMEISESNLINGNINNSNMTSKKNVFDQSGSHLVSQTNVNASQRLLRIETTPPPTLHIVAEEKEKEKDKDTENENENEFRKENTSTKKDKNESQHETNVSVNSDEENSQKNNGKKKRMQNLNKVADLLTTFGIITKNNSINSNDNQRDASKTKSKMITQELTQKQQNNNPTTTTKLKSSSSTRGVSLKTGRDDDAIVKSDSLPVAGGTIANVNVNVNHDHGLIRDASFYTGTNMRRNARGKTLLYNTPQSLLQREVRMLKKENRRLQSNIVKLMEYIDDQSNSKKKNNAKSNETISSNNCNSYNPKLDIDILLDTDIIVESAKSYQD